MSADRGIDVARAGQRLKRKVLVALVLSSGVPMLVLLVVVLPTLGTGISQMLIVLTIVGMLAGAWVIWDLGRIGPLMASESVRSGFERTIERQAAEINTYATRLDAAYKELESTHARWKETSFKDEVTGLYNRRFLLLRLEEEVGRWCRFSHPCSLVLLELEGLRMGYGAYDAALAAFARILMAPPRSTVSVIARYGGSRFAALLVETRRQGAFRFVQLVRNGVAAEYPPADEIGLRVGIASLPEDGADAEQLLSAADAVLRRGLPAG